MLAFYYSPLELRTAIFVVNTREIYRFGWEMVHFVTFLNFLYENTCNKRVYIVQL